MEASMKHTLIAAIAITALSTSALAGSYYKCTVNGKTVYSQTKCSSDASRQYVPDSGTRGLRQGELDMLERIERQEAYQQDRKAAAREHSRRHTLSYGDQQRIKRLEMKRHSLSMERQRGGKSWDENLSLSDEIRGIDRQIEQIRAPKW
jgi:hypothetical protein